MRKRRSSRRKKSGSRKVLLILAALIVLLILVAIVVIKPPEFIQTVIEPEDQEEEEQLEDVEGSVIDLAGEAGRKEGWYTFLVAGTDASDANTDTIMVGAYNAVDKEVHVVNIPRDTLVNTNWSVKKINASYARGGIEGLQRELKKIMGFVPDSYAIVDLDAFVELVDAIGGVTFDVPQDMNYYDPDQNLRINLKKGVQVLDGYNAMCVMRYRSGYATADIGRIGTQQEFLKAFAKQCLSIGNVSKVKEFARIFKEYVDTDMSLGNIVWYGKEFLSMGVDSIQFHTLPADTSLSINGGSYVGIYVNQWLEMLNQYLNPYEKDISASNLNILTKSGGSFYSTSGVIAGGEDSFYDYGGGRKNGGKTQQEQEEETLPPDEEIDPGLSGEGESGDPGQSGQHAADPGQSGQHAADPGDQGGQSGSEPGGHDDQGQSGDQGGQSSNEPGGNDDQGQSGQSGSEPAVQPEPQQPSGGGESTVPEWLLTQENGAGE